MKPTKCGLALAAGGLWLLSLALPSVASAQARPSDPAGKPAKAVTLEDVRSVLGTARDDISGVSDFSQDGRGEVVIAYRYDDADQENFEIDFANEIAPRVQALYKHFKALDRVRFQVVVPDPSGVPMGKPFADFLIDRKTIEELHWTGFVSRYILEQVLKDRK